MYQITDTDREFEILLKDKLPDFEKDFEKNFFTQEATLELLSMGVSMSHSLDYKSNRTVWNVACFINITSYDLKVIIRSLIFSQREWEKRLFIRQACLLVYEAMNDFFELFGKEFRKIIARLQDKDFFETTLKEITKELNEYKNLYSDKLKQIRNVSVAHRDNDSIEQLKIIQSITWVDSFNMISEFDKIINKTGKFLQDLTSKSQELDDFK